MMPTSSSLGAACDHYDWPGASGFHDMKLLIVIANRRSGAFEAAMIPRRRYALYHTLLYIIPYGLRRPM